MNARLRVAGATLAVALLTVGCSSTSDSISDPNPGPVSADICVYLQRIAMEMTQEWIDALERCDVTVEDWLVSPDSSFAADEAGDLLERREALVDRWDGYDCAGSAFDVVARRADELTYNKPIVEYVVGQFRTRISRAASFVGD